MIFRIRCWLPKSLESITGLPMERLTFSLDIPTVGRRFPMERFSVSPDTNRVGRRFSHRHIAGLPMERLPVSPLNGVHIFLMYELLRDFTHSSGFSTRFTRPLANLRNNPASVVRDSTSGYNNVYSILTNRKGKDTQDEF